MNSELNFELLSYQKPPFIIKGDEEVFKQKKIFYDERVNDKSCVFQSA